MATLNDISVPFRRLLKPWPKLDVDEQGATATTSFKTAPGDAFQFLRDCSGAIEQIGGAGGILIRRVPLLFPESPALYAYKGSIEWRGASGKDGLGSFHAATEVCSYAIVTVEFRTVPWAMNQSNTDSDWVSYQAHSAPTRYTLPGKYYHFVSDNLPLGQDVGIPVPEQQMSYTLHWVPDLDALEDKLTPLLGCVNTAPIRDKAPGTVIFEAFDTAAQLSTFGNLSQDVGVTLRWRPRPWTQALRPGGGWDEIADAAGNPPAASADLNEIFTF